MRKANDAYGALLYPEAADYQPCDVPHWQAANDAPKASHLKSVCKCFTWRGVAAVDTAVIVLFITGGSLYSAVGVVGLEAISKIAWMYGHERLWETRFVNRLLAIVERRKHA